MKRSIRVVLFVFLLAVCLTGGGETQKAYAADFAGGNGTYTNPYQVATPDQLNQVRNYLGSYFIQTADIDLSGFANWIPIGNIDSNFTGIYDGNGHKISQLTINVASSDPAGLFGVCSAGSTLINIKLDQVNVTGNTKVGALVGKSYGEIIKCSVQNGIVSNVECSGFGYPGGGLAGEVENGFVEGCYADVQVSGKAQLGGLIGLTFDNTTVKRCQSAGSVNGTQYVGGLVGIADIHSGFDGSQTITESFSSASVTGTDESGGLVGYVSASDISNCFSTGQVSGTNYVGGLLGRIQLQSKVENCYSTGQVTGTSNTGGLIGYKYEITVIGSYYDRETSGKSDTGKGIPKTTAEMKQQATYSGWDFSGIWKISAGVDYPCFKLAYLQDTLNSFGWGSGTSGDPYQVACSWELNKTRNYSGANIYFMQTGDIDLSGLNWIPIGSNWASHYNGNNYRITGLTCDRPSEGFVGLFGWLGYSSELRNINLIDVNVRGNVDVGGLAGYVGIVINCHVSGSVTGSSCVGGLTGDVSQLTDSSSSANVSGGTYVGGLSGINFRTINRSCSTGNVTGFTHVGGLLGNNIDYAKIYNSYSTGNVTGTTNVGGLVGSAESNSQVNTSYSFGNVTGTTNVGGCIGLNNGVLTSSLYNREAITDPGFDHSALNKGVPQLIYGLKQQSTYAGWDFSNTWQIANGVSRPQLKWESFHDFVHPIVASVSPAGDVTTAYPVKNLIITFDETVHKGTGNITVTRNSGESEVIAVTGGQVTVSNKTVTIVPAEKLLWGETYQVVFGQGTFADTAGNQCNESAWSFTLSAAVLEMNVPAGVSLGVPFSVTVTATDGSGNTLEGYEGRVHFASSDGAALLPQDYTFTAGDMGTKTFSVTLKNEGQRTITVNDTEYDVLTCSGTVEVVGVHVTGAETNREGTTVSLSFDWAMADPAGKQGQFTLKVNGSRRPLTAASLRSGDHNKIDLTVGNAPIFSGDTVSISYTPGNIAAEDGKVLAPLTDYAVTNTLPAAANLALPANGGVAAASSTLTSDGFKLSDLNDGTRDWYWNDGTNGDYTDDWCEVNWSGGVQEINKVVLRVPVRNDLTELQRRIGPLTVQYRDQSDAYHDLETVNSWLAPTTSDGTEINIFTAYPALNAKAVRIKFTGGNDDGWVFLEELEVYNVPNTIVSSKENHYTVDNEGNSITAQETGITTGTTAGAFLGNLNKQSGSAWKVVAEGLSITTEEEFDAAAGRDDGDTLAIGDKLAVLAGDSSALQVYTITVEFLLDQGGLNYLSSNRAVTPNMIEFGDNLYATWAENNGGHTQIRVKKFDGTTWSSADDNSILNSNSGNNAYNPVLCEFNNSLYLAWYEDPGSAEIYQVYVRKYHSGNWDPEINLSCSGNKAFNIKLAADNSYLSAVWVEKDDEGKEQVRVKMTSDGSTWNDAGPESLNYNAARAASLPDMEIFNNNLFAAWSEKGLIRVRKYDGDAWSTADNNASLNYDPAKVADMPVFINNGTDLYLIWGEKTDNDTGNYQVRGSKYNGSTWDSISDDSGLNDDPAKGAYMLSGRAYLGTIYTGWTESLEGSVIIKTYTDQGGWGAANGINYDQAEASSGISFTVFNGTLYAAWNEKSGGVEQIRVKSIGHE